MISPECVDWYAQYAAKRWKIEARAELNRQMLVSAIMEPAVRDGFLLAMEQLEEMPAPVDITAFIQTCNTRAVQFYGKAA